MIQRDLTVSGPPELDVHAPAAAVTIERGPAGTVTVQIDTKRAEDWVVSQSGDAIRIRDERSGWRHRAGGRVRITTPDGAGVRVTTASGDVTIAVATGHTSITTASGDIRVGITGSLAVKSASGDIVIDRVLAAAETKTASGDVSANDVGGALIASTASGDIRVDRAGGDVRISTASGDIRVSRFEGAAFNANTVSGDVSLGIPSGRAVDLDVNTFTGDVVLPARRPGGPAPATDRRVTVKVKSVSGDFRLQRA